MSNTTTVVNFLIQSGYLAAAVAAASSAIKYGKTVLDAKTAELTSKIKNESVKNAVNTAEDCVSTVVSELAQTTVEAAKAKSADGKLTAADAAAIKVTAVQKAQALMSDDVVHTLNTLYGDAETWISSKIEAAVKALKSSTVSTAPVATALLQSTANIGNTAAPVDASTSNEAPAEETSANAASADASTPSVQPTATQAPAAPQNITVNVTVPTTATQAEIAQQITAAIQQAQVSGTVKA